MLFRSSVLFSSPPIFSSHSPLFIRFLPFHRMSLVQSQPSSAFLHPMLTEDFNSESLWINNAIDSIFGEETLHLLQGFTLDDATQPFPSSEDDYFLPPPSPKGNQRVGVDG